MYILWLITGASLVMAFVAWRRARGTAERLEQLTKMYWELKYQHGELRARVQTGAAGASSPRDEPPPPAVTSHAFIPLTSLKR